MAATRAAAAVTLALLALPTSAQQGQTRPAPPPTRQPPPPSRPAPPPLPRPDLVKDVGSFMMTCVRQASTMAEKLACRTRAKEEFDNSTRSETAMSGGKREAYFEKFQRKAAEDTAKDKVRACLEADNQSRQQMSACMTQARTELGSALENYIKPDKSAEGKTRQKQEMEKEASRDILGEVFSRCVQSADRRTCMSQLSSRKEAAGLAAEDAGNIVKRHLSKMLMKPAQNCSGGDMRQCREDAKREAMNGGMKRHEYAAMKKMGEIKAAAETWAGCKDAGNDDATCEDMIREEFVRVSGARDADFDADLKNRVKSLGRAIKDGDTIRVVKFKRMLVNAFTSGSDCVATLEALFAAKVYSVAKANNTNVSRAVERKCRVVDLKPEYGAKVDVDLPDSDIEELAAATSANLVGDSLQRRLEEAELPEVARALRRLESVSEVFAAQDVAECGASDNACISGTPSPTPAPTPVQGTVGGACRTAAAASIVVAVVAAALF